MKLLSILLVLLTLTGCVTHNADRGFSFDNNQGMGLLVGSLTTDNPGHLFGQDVSIFFEPLGDSKGSRSRVTMNNHCKFSETGNGAGRAPDDDPDAVTPEDMHSSDFKDYCGKLFVIVLPPGGYALNEWSIADAGGGVITPEHWQPAKVTIQAGKATYVGNIHVAFDPTIPGGGPDGWHGWPKVSDMHERDMSMLLGRYPLLRQSDVTMGLLSLDPPGRVCITGTVMFVTVTNCGH